MGKGKLAKFLPLALLGLGGVMLVKASSNGNGSGTGEGMLGGTDDLSDDGRYVPYDEQGYYENELPREEFLEEAPLYEDFPSYPQDISNNDISTNDAYDTKSPISDTSDFSNPFTDISKTDALLGASGFIKSFSTTLGENIGKKTKSVVSNAGSSTTKKIVGTSDEIAEAGTKKAMSIGFDSAEASTESLIKQSDNIFTQTIKSFPYGKQALKVVSSETVESGGKGILKTIGKKAGKGVVSSLPIIGLFGGTAFDIRSIPQLKNQWDNGGIWGKTKSISQAFSANLVGDVVGGAGAVVTSFTGIGAVAVAVGGQVAGEYGAYKLFGVDSWANEVNEKTTSAFNFNVNPLAIGSDDALTITPKNESVINQSGYKTPVVSSTPVQISNNSSSKKSAPKMSSNAVKVSSKSGKDYKSTNYQYFKNSPSGVTSSGWSYGTPATTPTKSSSSKSSSSRSSSSSSRSSSKSSSKKSSSSSNVRKAKISKRASKRYYRNR